MNRDIEALKKQAKLFGEISDLLNEAVELSEKSRQRRNRNGRRRIDRKIRRNNGQICCKNYED